MGAYPLLISNVKGRNQTLGTRIIVMEGGLKHPVIPSMTRQISDRENAREICGRLSSLMSTNINDGNKRSYTSCMKAAIKHTLDNR